MQNENQSSEINILKTKYELHKQPEVEQAARRHFAKTHERVSQNPLARIDNYLDRFHEITDRTDINEREHGINAAKRWLYSKFVIKPDEVPESYFENQKRLAKEQGRGDIIISKTQRDHLAEVIVTDQKSSIDLWVDYLSSPDAIYSDGLKYWTLRSVLSMGAFDKETGKFSERSKQTISPFPDLNREALAYVLDAISKKHKGYDIDLTKLEEQNRPEFEKLLKNENFPKLYAWAIEKVTPASKEDLKVTEGKWVKYSQKSDPRPLVESLQGHGTGWCTAGESTAKAQLDAGDFYVFYSMDKGGNPTVPRIAIRMQGESIAEVRGVSKSQNIDSGVAEIIEEKLKEFPDGKLYKKRVRDMEALTRIENKVNEGHTLNAAELSFLYELDSKIAGFGYTRDPRIDNLMSGDIEGDMLIIFECEPSQIARKTNEINETTKAYVGPLEPKIFTTLQKFNIEHIYTKFPEGRVKIQSLEIGGKEGKQLIRELDENEISHTESTDELLKSRHFKTLLDRQEIKLVSINGSDLRSFREQHVANQEVNYQRDTEKINAKVEKRIYKYAQELGLDLCPAEVAPHFILKYKELPTNSMPHIIFETRPIKVSSLFNSWEGFFDFAQSDNYMSLYGRDYSYLNSFLDDERYIFALPQSI